MGRAHRKAVVIDDEIHISAMVCLLLERLGFAVQCASDGESGLALVKREEPDLLVVDMLLPKLHGLEICKAIRRSPVLSRIRIVAMTAIYKRLKFRLEAGDVRVDAYVEKPFDVKEFTNVIQGLFPGDFTDNEVEAYAEFVQKKVEEQAVSFAGKLPEMLKAITKLWGLYRLDQENPGDLDEMRKLVHQLTGSASLYGFHEVSRICRQLGKTLSDIEENGGAIIKSQQTEMSSLLGVLADVARNTGKVNSALLPDRLKENYLNLEIPVTIISMNPHHLEELVAGMSGFGYAAKLIRFGDLGRKGFFLETENVIVDLQKRPSGTAWIKKINVCGGTGPLNVVAIADEHGFDPGKMKSGSEPFCWKWIKRSADVYDVIRKLEENAKPSQSEEPYRLLIVMKEMAMSEHFQILLRQEGFLANACEGNQIFMSVREFHPDVVLLDLQKPIQDTIAQVRTIRSWRQDIPIVVNADSFSPEDMNHLTEHWVMDVVSTGNTFGRLAFSLESYARCWRQVRENRTKYFLSGVYRYAPFMEAMETELKWASLSGKSMSVAVFGLDHVAELNRKSGEREVDRMSEALCRLIRGQMEGRDRVGQVGGGVFAGFFTGMEGQMLQRFLSDLRHYFSSLSFFHERGKLKATFSAGISRFPNLSDRNDLFEAALDAMLRAQKSGGNRIVSTF
ncbi:MAG: response regulator [Acidobacteria bacterium]|nr:response regulator [Acidobacteriota bacterium]